MIAEGGLRKPERGNINLGDPKFWDEKSLDKELRRQFDVCHSCRRCFNLCDSFPKLFDIIDDAPSMELDTVNSNSFKGVVDACTLCDMCFMVSCPYVPPHEFAVDIPSLFIRYKALENEKNSNFIDNEIAKTDRNGKIGLFFSAGLNFLLKKKRLVFRRLLSFLVNIDVSATLPKFNKKSFKAFFKYYKVKFKHKKKL
jgi:glycerol-3-phosphate dehydrogenase subunit C